jgi:hypothetical protein
MEGVISDLGGEPFGFFLTTAELGSVFDFNSAGFSSE